MMPTAVKGAAELLCEYYFLNYLNNKKKLCKRVKQDVFSRFKNCRKLFYFLILTKKERTTSAGHQYPVSVGELHYVSNI